MAKVPLPWRKGATANQAEVQQKSVGFFKGFPPTHTHTHSALAENTAMPALTFYVVALPLLNYNFLLRLKESFSLTCKMEMAFVPNPPEFG